MFVLTDAQLARTGETNMSAPSDSGCAHCRERAARLLQDVGRREKSLLRIRDNTPVTSTVRCLFRATHYLHSPVIIAATA
jgi:hypothetical protein